MSTPPKLAAFALRRICSKDTLPEVEGDFLEAFSYWTETHGPSFARRRYWREVTCLAFWRWVDMGRQLLNRQGAKENQRAAGSGPSPSQGGGRWSGDLLLDIRFGIRRMVTNPVSSGIAMLLLAIGIGGNTTVFTVVQETLRKPPPLIQGALFGVAPTDPLVFSVVPGLLLLGCLIASLVPALRASSINPVEALSRE